MNSATVLCALSLMMVNKVIAREQRPSLSPPCYITFGGSDDLYLQGFPERHLKETLSGALPNCRISDDPRTTPAWKETILSTGWTNCIIDQLCNPHPIASLTDRAGCLIACYRECAVTTASWEKCQEEGLKGKLNTAAQLQTILCDQLTSPGYYAKFTNYSRCLAKELTTDLQSQVIQVNFSVILTLYVALSSSVRRDAVRKWFVVTFAITPLAKTRTLFTIVGIVQICSFNGTWQNYKNFRNQ